MKNLLLLLIFIPAFSFASGTLKEVSLSPELAEKLGFSINVKPEGGTVMIELKGPKNGPSGCPVSRSGVFLLGKNGEELLVYITELEKADSPPQAVGYYTSSENSMGVFIDYICTGTKVLQSIRYSVQSIKAWGS
ncbi:hypothetical protein [Teredinibacter turnerae]|uniref:hypothetical protein n=1 Tax=Teredinibacter turnerae TaxID=2426 RepID=UPI0003744BA0|nr:hypothetical protein [Teredinibacter turnerae]